MKKILFIAMPFSIHTSRWIEQLADSGFDIHLISSMDGYNLHPTIRNITFHENTVEIQGDLVSGNRYLALQFPGGLGKKSPFIRKIIRRSLTLTGLRRTREMHVRKLINQLQPDVIHTLETQHAGYIVSRVKQNFTGKFPFWIHSNWGIDLHYFHRISWHQPMIYQILQQISLLIVEGKRDEKLARDLGFRGKIETFPSVGGGFRIPEIDQIPPSKRKKILLKGTQDIVRRGLVGMRALARCSDLLEAYEIVLYSSNEETRHGAELFFHETGKKIEVLKEITNAELLLLNAEARINITVNMSDGLPNSMLEAMMMGAFPIQSNTSLADEWIEDGETGMLVPPEDPDLIEKAIRKALTDNQMVDQAAHINMQKIRKELPFEEIKEKAIALYNGVLGNTN